MGVSAAEVKRLRDCTGAGMMECKKALEIANGHLPKAIEELRKSGCAKADKKAGRIAAQGVVMIERVATSKSTAMLEVNSETDFVARDENFLRFMRKVAETVLSTKVMDVVSLSGLPLAGAKGLTVEDARKALVAKVGENVHIRRIAFSEATHLGTYVHSNRIGVIVELDEDYPELAKDIAMHIAASKPLVISPQEVPADIIEKEKEIFLAQAANSGKPQDIIEKMVSGRIKKFLDEVSLLGQPFVKDPNMTIASLLTKHRAKVRSFVRFEVGEGIEKETEDFVAAVMSQVQGS